MKKRLISSLLLICILVTIGIPVAFADTETVIKEPTCTEIGVKKIVKTDGTTTYERIAPTEHTVEESKGTITKAATCGEDGVLEMTCSVCGQTVTKTIAASGEHLWEEKIVTEATCTEPAMIGKVCKVCGLEDNELKPTGSAKGHTWVEDSFVEATCTEPAKIGRVCSVCKATDGSPKEVGTALGHDFQPVVTAPTCTEKGYTEYKCSRCELEDPSRPGHQDETAATGHKPVIDKILKEADCANGVTGIAKYICSVCKTDTGEGLGYQAFENHTFVEGIKQDATCTEAALVGKYCSKCGKDDGIKTVGSALGHNYTNVVTAPTCEEEGYTIPTCSRCGDTKAKQDVTAALGHSWEKKVIKEPDYQNNTPGIAQNICSVCGKAGEYEEISVAAHTHTEVEIPAVAPTCTTSGLTAGKKCSVCGEITVKQTEIPATGHTAVAVPAIEATCKAAGQTAGQKCSVCGTVLSGCEVIPATAHTPVSIPAKPATCTEDGNTEGSVCSVCGTILSGQKIPSRGGHSFYEAGTYVSDDSLSFMVEYTCLVCGYTERRTQSIG